MCGIIGYVGTKDAMPVALEGLRRLEYRGYDSAGVAVCSPSGITSCRAVGRVAVLEQKLLATPLMGSVAIAHTRWATHGKPTEINAHPHQDCTGAISLVHNGIIENYAELREALTREGHRFRSETDTEVLSHLVERAFALDRATKHLEDAVLEALRHVVGTFGIAVVSSRDPNKIVAARRGSPLVVGVGEGEMLVASDIAALVGSTKNIIYINDDELAVLTPKAYSIFNFAKKALRKSVQIVDWDLADAQKGGFDHFMKKEIFEEPVTLENTFRGRIFVEPKEGKHIKLGGLESVAKKLTKIQRLVIVACGTSYYSGLIGKQYFEEFAGIPTTVEYASEFRYGACSVDKKTAVIAISQSGETADTLEALRVAKKHGALTLGVVNVVGSTIARESDAGVYSHAGPEIGVASTKAFIAQIGVMLLMALFFAEERKVDVDFETIAREAKALPSKIKKTLDLDEAIHALAKRSISNEAFLYVGRKYQFPVAMEGALKLKEISYRHAEGYAAGEMKHGPIALIERGFPVLVLAPQDSVYEKMISNIQELKAREAWVIAIATYGDATIKQMADEILYIPKTIEVLGPLLSVIPLQLFAYHTAALLGLDVDKPRNLAKSVTVE